MTRTLCQTLLTFVTLLLALPVAAQTVHPLRVTLETTSDQARLEIRGLRLLEQHRTVTVAGSVPGQVTEGLTIRKPPFDNTPVTLRVDLLATPTGDGPVEWRLQRGPAGTTRLRVEVAGRTLLDQKLAGQGEKDPPWLWQPDLGKLLGARPVPRTDFGRKVLAFYYGWYGAPTGPAKEWRHWDPKRPDHASAHTPLLGWYDSTDPKIVAQHVTWAKQAGLEAFVLSWWLRDAHEKTVLRLLLDEAVRQGPFQVGVYIEAAPTAESLRAQVQEILQLVGKHPALLRVQGKPVVFLYTRIMQDLGNDGLRRALHDLGVFAVGDLLQPVTLEAVEAAHTYVSASVPDKYQQELHDTQLAGRLRDKLVLATVMPGYDDTHVRTPGGIDHRERGRFYDGEWAMAALADWVVLTSFNEWHEGSEIEPSLELGAKYLEATRAWVERWRGGK
jgi:glycoprotein endo-alpha-1,2-mannosidase